MKASFEEPPAPQAPGQEPAAPEIQAGEIPKEGLTAGDIAMQQVVPDPQKDPYGFLLYTLDSNFKSIDGNFKSTNKRLDDQGKAIINMAEKVYGPQSATGQAVQAGANPAGGMNFGGLPINDIIGLVKGAVNGGDPMQEYFASIGKTIFDKTLEGTMKRVSSGLAGEGAKHVLG